MQLAELLRGVPIGTAHAFRWGGLPATPWWRKYEQSGGQLVEQTTHQVDLFRWLMGEITAVSASYSFDRLLADEDGVTVPDSQAVLLHFASGASATVSTSCGVGDGYLGGIEFVTKNARVSFTGQGVRVAPEDALAIPLAAADPISVDAAFITAIANDDAALLRSPYADALITAAVTLAANRSAEAGGRLVPMSEMLADG